MKVAAFLSLVALAACGDDGPQQQVQSDSNDWDSSTIDTPSGGGNGQWVLGYYVGYAINAYPINSIQWSSLTHIAFAPMLVNTDQTLDFSFNDQQGMGQTHAMQLSAAAHAHGVKALLMLGGANAGANIAVAARPANRAAFVNRLLAALTTLGYDGIDLDWEDSVVLDDLVGLAHDLRAAKPDILLSFPAGTLNGNIDTVDPKMVDLAMSLDRFMVQTYYPSTAVAGFGWSSWFVAPLSGVTGATPIAADDTLMRYAAAGIPKAKLGLGIGAYAICYTGGITGPRQPTNGTSQTITGGDNYVPLRTFFTSTTFTNASAAAKQYDSVAQQPYLTFTSAQTVQGCMGTTQYVSYEDPTSIIAKGTFSKQNGYGGIIIWTINELDPTTTQALHDGFIAP